MLNVWGKSDEKNNYELQLQLDQHRYTIQSLDFSSCGSKIVSCSMDGMLIHWDLQTGLSFEMKKCENGLRTCKFSSENDLIACAGDDEVVFLWDANSLEFKKQLQRHRDAITCVAFSPDNRYICSTCLAGEIKVYNLVSSDDNNCCLSQENAHDLGAISCEFSKQYSEYILATCGNDSLVKLWRITESLIVFIADLAGHGGNVMCVKFSLNIYYLLVSAATDNTARLWNTTTKECLYVIDHHESMVNTCAFSYNSNLLATGSMDRSLVLWTIPTIKHFENSQTLLERARVKKSLQYWTEKDVYEWFSDMGFLDEAEIFSNNSINGSTILKLQEDDLLEKVNMGGDKNVRQLLSWLKKEVNGQTVVDDEIPHEFLCPITHDIMKDPVLCSALFQKMNDSNVRPSLHVRSTPFSMGMGMTPSEFAPSTTYAIYATVEFVILYLIFSYLPDGFTYERGAILEWILSGRFSSPMTNQPLSKQFKLNAPLKIAIFKFLYDEK